MKTTGSKIKMIITALLMAMVLGGADCTTYQPTDEDIEAVVSAVTDYLAVINSAVTTYSTTLDQDLLGEGFNNDGCPVVSMAGVIGSRTVSVSYADNCTVDTMKISGAISGAWTFAQGDGVTVDLTLDEFGLEDQLSSGEVSLTANALQGLQVTVDADVTTGGRQLSIADMIATADFNDTVTDPYDDTYMASGSGSYADDVYTYEIAATDITAQFLCYVPVSGAMTLKSATPPYTADVDFGDGTCDQVFTVTIGLRTETIDLADWL